MDTVVLSQEEYQNLVDALDHAVALRNVATGAMETLSDAELDAYLQAATPLAFWRQKRGLPRAELAAAIGLPETALSEFESGTASASVTEAAKIARALRIRIEDLVPEE